MLNPSTSWIRGHSGLSLFLTIPAIAPQVSATIATQYPVAHGIDRRFTPPASTVGHGYAKEVVAAGSAHELALENKKSVLKLTIFVRGYLHSETILNSVLRCTLFLGEITEGFKPRERASRPRVDVDPNMILNLLVLILQGIDDRRRRCMRTIQAAHRR